MAGIFEESRRFGMNLEDLTGTFKNVYHSAGIFKIVYNSERFLGVAQLGPLLKWSIQSCKNLGKSRYRPSSICINGSTSRKKSGLQNVLQKRGADFKVMTFEVATSVNYELTRTFLRVKLERTRLWILTTGGFFNKDCFDRFYSLYIVSFFCPLKTLSLCNYTTQSRNLGL